MRAILMNQTKGGSNSFELFEYKLSDNDIRLLTLRFAISMFLATLVQCRSNLARFQLLLCEVHNPVRIAESHFQRN